jgi:AcrR family transcriptional regulator
MRQTSAQIDEGILDVAAGIFATHGYAHTSVQQVADAVGYSKAGLLHRFGSKEALHRSAVSQAVQLVTNVVSQAKAVPAGREQSRRVMELFAANVLDHTGMVQLMLRAFEPTNEDPGIEDLQSAGYNLVDVLDQPSSTPVERLRIVLALQLLVNGALAQTSEVDSDLHVPRGQLVPMLAKLANGVMTGSV